MDWYSKGTLTTSNQCQYYTCCRNIKNLCMVPETSISQDGLCFIENSKGEWGWEEGARGEGWGGLKSQKLFQTWNLGTREGGGGFEPNLLCRRTINIFWDKLGFGSWFPITRSSSCTFSITFRICMLGVTMSPELRLFYTGKIAE